MNDWEIWLAIGVALLISYAILLWLGLVVWTYFDMKDRSHDPLARWVATGAVFLFNIPGFFLYLIFRPHETLVEAYERRLESEALKTELAEQHRTCPSCRRNTRDDFLLCPHCKTVLQEPCVHCEKPLELSWVVCPYCGTSGPRAPAAVPAAAAAVPPLERPATQPPPIEAPPLAQPAPNPGASRPRTRASGSRSQPSGADGASGAGAPETGAATATTSAKPEPGASTSAPTGPAS